jgi:hypothetical protein
MLETPETMNTTTQPEMTNVTVQKVHRFACLNGGNCGMLNCNQRQAEVIKMDNQQPSLFEGKKICRICGETKAISEFHVYGCRTRKARITDVCETCHKARLHEWYEKRHAAYTPEDRQQHNERARQWRDANPEKRMEISRRSHKKSRHHDKAVVHAAYGGKCACCGEKEPMFLTVDHINNDGHAERKSGLYGSTERFYRWVIKNNFPDCYQLLCYNCNLGKAHNNGVCPHQKGSEIIPKGSRAKRPEAPSIRLAAG